MYFEKKNVNKNLMSSNQKNLKNHSQVFIFCVFLNIQKFNLEIGKFLLQINFFISKLCLKTDENKQTNYKQKVRGAI